MPLETARTITHDYYYILLSRKIKNTVKCTLHPAGIVLKTMSLQPEDFNRAMKYNLIYFPDLWKPFMKKLPTDTEQVV
jgi:hypothetical protein